MNPDDQETVFLLIQRAMADVGLASGTGNRFVVEDTTKGGEDRDIGLSRKLSAMLVTHIKEQRLRPDDLLFPLSRLKAEYELANPEPEPYLVPIPLDLGRTEPNVGGRTFQHGTISGHRNGGCKCRWCRQATANHRAERPQHHLAGPETHACDVAGQERSDRPTATIGTNTRGNRSET